MFMQNNYILRGGALFPRSSRAQKLKETIYLNSVFTFVQRANNYHDTIKFTAEISDSEITFLDTKVYKGERFNR